MSEANQISLTDLMNRTEDLCEELSERLFDGALGKMIHHPLMIEISYHPQMNAVYNYRLKMLTEQVQKAQAAGDWTKVLVLHARPYRLEILHSIVLQGCYDDPKEYWPVVVEFWMDCENVWENYDSWIDLWSLEDMGCPREHGMEDDEIAALNALPDEITVYRTVAAEDYASGLSWTVDRDVAVGIFGKHPNVLVQGRSPKLVTATVRKMDVIVFLQGRGEEEIVINPDHVKITSIEPLTPDEIAASSAIIRKRRETK